MMRSGHNPILKSAILEVVSNQMEANDPPETRQTYDRLRSEGISDEEARRLLGCVVVAEIFDVIKKGREFDIDRFRAALRQLPDTSFLDE